jgi:subtilisin family serine protease
MSYGSPSRCIAEERQIQRAVKAGAIPVAAAGNEFQEGNPAEFPASLSHVITVTATDPLDKPTGFSNESAAVDLAAPGIGILTAVPGQFDNDGTPDGYLAVSGTSFSAPMVSAAVAWIRAARPELTPFQAAQAVRLGARDVGAPGYENATGFGVLSLPIALAFQPPADDPLEPNDDIRYVNGRAFRDIASPISNGRPGSVSAVADAAEDPIDVYRVKVRAGRKMRITLKPSVGDPDLFVFGAKARSVSARPKGISTRSGKRTDRVTVRNRGRKSTTFYAAVGFNRRKDLKLLNATYTLRAG